MALEINLFVSFIGLCMIAGVVGIIIRMPFLMLVGGAMIAFLCIIPLDFVQGSRVESIEEIGNEHFITWQDEPVQFDTYPKILFGVLGSIFMLAGGLMWKYQD